MQLRRDGDRFLLAAAVRHELPLVEGEPGSALSPGVLRSLLRSAGFRGRSVIVGLGPPDVEFHPLEIPASILTSDRNRAELAVREELERVSLRLNGPMEARYWALPPAGPSAPTAMGVAANRAASSAVARAVADSGFACRQVAVTAAALTNVAAVLGVWEPDQIGGVLDLGLRQSRLIVCAAGEPVSVRHIGPGGQFWTQRVSEALDVSPRAAEVQKRDCGMATGPTGSDELRSGLASLVFGALRRELTDLAGEIKRSYEYVMRCYPARAAGDLILTGGGSLLPGLDEFLHGALGISVSTAGACLQRPSCRLQYDGNRREPLSLFALSVGLVVGR